LQWSLDFQGSTNGQIVGIAYDSPTPAASGMVINPNAGTAVTLSASMLSNRGIAITKFGSFFDVVVSGQVTSGANTTSGAENGIMQFVHDVNVSVGGVVQVVSVTPASPFAITRPDAQTLLGTSDDLGVELVNGYTTSFTQGLTASSELYRVTFRVIGVGGVDISIAPAAEAKFAASTPFGVKIGHTGDLTDTAQLGDPAAASYPAVLTVVGGIPGDDDGDGDVDASDFLRFPECMTGPGGGLLTDCGVYDFDVDNDVDLSDYLAFTQAVN
jgi:hypothetical protein